MKKTIVLLTVLVCLLSLIGCSAQTPEKPEIPEKPETDLEFWIAEMWMTLIFPAGRNDTV